MANQQKESNLTCFDVKPMQIRLVSMIYTFNYKHNLISPKQCLKIFKKIRETISYRHLDQLQHQTSLLS